MEPPETPAPVFALRAFKSALFGTPGEEEEKEEENQGQAVKLKSIPAINPIGKTDALKQTTGSAEDAEPTKKDVDLDTQVMVSPTKGILVTPGTISNRRKTVSFGQEVVDNERKRDASPSKTPRTPTQKPGNVSSQWLSASSDGKNKPRSKLTQTLMDAREKTPPTSQPTRTGQKELAEAQTKVCSDDHNDETLNLDEPRSQSGKYWKAEFESYRVKTNREIKRLIQYRSIAKSYARRKDEEAARLAQKLREEESRVAAMERHVTKLASNMVTESKGADKEQLIQDLTRQTALALQYKHRVNLLRKMLETHGVVSGELDEIAGQATDPMPSDPSADELRKAQQALSQANSKIEELRQQQRSDLEKLQNLAQSSETKAIELEKENMSLKQTLARVKQEMNKYEGRRKEKEARLKQREAKLEMRVQEYRERIKQHRESEEALKDSFDEERNRMQGEIDLLKLKLATVEHFPEMRNPRRYTYSPRKVYPGVKVYDFGLSNDLELQENETEEFEEPPSPSPRSKDRSRQTRASTTAMHDLRRATRRIGAEDNEEFTDYLDHSPRKALPYFSHQPLTANHEVMLPSSPPEISQFDTSARILAEQQQYQRDNRRAYASLRSNMITLPPPIPDLGEEHTQSRTQRLQSRRAPAKPRLESNPILAAPRVRSAAVHHVGSSRPGKKANLASVQIDAMTAERIAAAQARLRRKELNRRLKDEGKENIKAYAD